VLRIADYRDKWRSFAYRKAIAALKAHHSQVNSAEEALKIRGVGKSIAEKVIMLKECQNVVCSSNPPSNHFRLVKSYPRVDYAKRKPQMSLHKQWICFPRFGVGHHFPVKKSVFSESLLL